MTPDHPKKLFLLDAFALIYRAYYAFIKNPRVNSKGQNTSAAFGFTTVLLNVIKQEKPTHIAVVFDGPEETHRSQEFADYKAHREAMPEDISSMIGPIKQIVEAFKIPVLIKAGFEADDIIGTIAKIAEKEGFLTYMMTPDKDYAQLVSENIFMYKPSRGGNPPEIWGVPEVLKNFEVERPEQVIDVLGLWGDASDNIPGIPGIGEKTAKKLVAKYGSVEGLLDHANELSGKQKENVIQFAEQGRLSKRLATITLDVPVAFEPDKLILEPADKEKVTQIFTELEFRTLAKQVIGEEIFITPSTGTKSKSAPTSEDQLGLFGSDTDEPITEAPANVKTIVDKMVNYEIVVSADKRKQLLDLMLGQKSVCFDTETTGLDPITDEIVGMSFCFAQGTAFYVSCLPHERQQCVQDFRAFFESERIEKTGHNIKFDLQFIEKYGVQMRGPMFDTMIAHYLIDSNENKRSMDYLSEKYLHYRPISIETLLGKKGKNQGNMADLDPEKIVDYACEDADVTWQLKELFEKEVQQDHLKKLFYEIEMPLVRVLSDMEMEGIRIDVDALRSFSRELETDLIELDTEIRKHAGVQDFNIDSPRQLGDVLFDHLKIDEKAKRTKTGQYQTSEDVLSRLEHKHPIIPLILNYRELRKLKSTYVDSLPEMVNKHTGRVHTSYLQTVAATGRLASNNPNLQNIPIRTAKGREIRKAFIPRGEGYSLLSSDYSQIELRLIAAIAGDENMIAAFKAGHDIHAATAAKVFHVEKIEDVTREQRSSAKAVNFGIIYGQSAFGLSQNLNISRTEAKGIIDSYWEQYPKIRSYMKDTVEFARSHGYVETITQRRRYLRDINSENAIVRGFAERNAVNSPIQGSAADVIKIAMIAIHSEMKRQNLTSKMLLQVHDELVFDVIDSEKSAVEKLVKEKMESAVSLSVPMETDYKFAKNWLEAH